MEQRDPEDPVKKQASERNEENEFKKPGTPKKHENSEKPKPIPDKGGSPKKKIDDEKEIPLVPHYEPNPKITAKNIKLLEVLSSQRDTMKRILDDLKKCNEKIIIFRQNFKKDSPKTPKKGQ